MVGELLEFSGVGDASESLGLHSPSTWIAWQGAGSGRSSSPAWVAPVSPGLLTPQLQRSTKVVLAQGVLGPNRPAPDFSISPGMPQYLMHWDTPNQHPFHPSHATADKGLLSKIQRTLKTQLVRKQFYFKKKPDILTPYQRHTDGT